MLRKGFIKPKISIDRLGKRQFWIGIVGGVLMALVLSYLFNYSRESCRLVTFTRDPLLLTEQEFRLYDLFFAALATSMAYGFTVVLWFSVRTVDKKKRYFRSYIFTHSWFITLVTLSVIARFGTNLSIAPYGLYGYDGQLDLLREFSLMLVLIPIYIFCTNWNYIRLLFRSGLWVNVSVVICLFVAFYLFKTTSVDRGILNQGYYNLNKHKFDFIDTEFEKAIKHGIFFNDTVRTILRKEYADRTVSTLLEVKKAFEKSDFVSLDTLILEKILIHNLKNYNRFFDTTDKDVNWPYALPEHVYRQILMHDINSIEMSVLFEILVGQISILMQPRLIWASGICTQSLKEKNPDLEVYYCIELKPFKAG